MIRNPELYKTIKSYVAAAIDLVKREPDDRCLSNDWTDALGLLFVFSHEKLKRLPEYQKCRGKLLSDTVIASQLDTMVGIHIFRSRSPEIEQLMVRLPRLGVNENIIEFNDECFERKYSVFESVFYDDEFNYELIVPLSGPVFKAPIKIDETLEICPVDGSDLSVLTNRVADGGAARDGNTLWAIRSHYKLPKIVGNDVKTSLEEAGKNDKLRHQANRLVEQAIACFRLLGVSNIYPLTVIHRLESELFSDVRSYPIKYFPTHQYLQELPADFHQNLPRFWKNLQKAINKHKFIALAVKRFSYAHERHDWEDRIVDLLIAAEALFLSQSKIQNNISYRLKSQASEFLGTDAKTKKDIFDDMSLAYKLRSGIAHGSIELKNTVEKIEKREIITFGEEYKLRQFTYRIQEYVRAAVCKMIDLSALNKIR